MIADRAWISLADAGRFRTKGLAWDLEYVKSWATLRPLDGEEFGRGWDVLLAHPLVAGQPGSGSTSVLRGDIRRVVYSAATADGYVRAEARVFRLAAHPGWVMAHASYRPHGKRNAWGFLYVRGSLDAYDGSGRRVLHCAPPAGTSEPTCTATG